MIVEADRNDNLIVFLSSAHKANQVCIRGTNVILDKKKKKKKGTNASIEHAYARCTNLAPGKTQMSDAEFDQEFWPVVETLVLPNIQLLVNDLSIGYCGFR